jgi:hypothetical protein
MNNKDKIVKDEIGRPIPDWSKIDLLIPVSNGSYNMNPISFLSKHKFLTALTDVSQSRKNHHFIRCRLKDGSKILNFNDRKDYAEIKRLSNADDIEEMDESCMKFISMGGYAGVFCPTKAGVHLCDPGLHLEFKGIEKEH